MATITFLAEEGCAASSIVGSIDAFDIANLWWMFMGDTPGKPLLETEIVTVDGAPVNASGTITLTPKKSMSEVEETDFVLLPAFLPPFDFHTPRMKNICQWIRDRHKKGDCIASTCTGAFLLAEAGLLNGRIATTNWYFASMFRKLYPDVDLRIDRMLTEDSGIFCTGAATAFMSLYLHIVEKFGSPELASTCAKAMLIDPDKASQSPYILCDFFKDHSDAEILKAQQWMEDQYMTKISIDEIADVVGVGARSFKRRFKSATGETPLVYLQRLRIENAKRRLETTKDTVNEITWQVGYEDINSFRRLFKKHTGMSPKGYRNKFSHISGA